MFSNLINFLAWKPNNKEFLIKRLEMLLMLLLMGIMEQFLHMDRLVVGKHSQ